MQTSRKTKALGQNFLRSKPIIKKILQKTYEQMRLYQCKNLLEIGPGDGALTRVIIKDYIDSLDEFIVIEKDKILSKKLNEDLKESKTKVINEDFLKSKVLENFFLKPTGVLSNLPYSVSTAILLKLTRFAVLSSSIPFMILMFQEEVAKKISSSPGEKTTTSLSLLIQNVWETQTVLHVSPQCFYPQPTIYSTVVSFKKREIPCIPLSSKNEGTLKAWENLVRICFLHRRKMMRHILKDKKNLENDIYQTKRAQELNWYEWNSLFNFFI